MEMDTLKKVSNSEEALTAIMNMFAKRAKLWSVTLYCVVYMWGRKDDFVFYSTVMSIVIQWGCLNALSGSRTDG